MPEHGILIGIAGGTGSGKTLVSETVHRVLGTDQILVIEQDAYYRDLSHLPLEARSHHNFDHPDAFDRDLLVSHLTDLKNGKAIRQPQYDYTHHCRRQDFRIIEPQHIIILEGILILEDPRLRELMDIKVYVDTDADVRLVRRIRRDVKERGRTVESVLDQYERHVQPMHLQFVEPSKRYADIIIPEGGKNLVAVDLLVTKIRSLLAQRNSQA
jgi:uridine kinase